MTTHNWAVERRAIIRDGLGVGLATGVYGLSFGAVGVASGLSVAQTCTLSLLMFTGASQFAFVGVIAAGGGAGAAIITAWLLGLRNTIYGLRLAALLQYAGWRRPAAAQLVIDESAAMALVREDTRSARVGFLSTGLGVFAFWNLATLLGALAGSAFANPQALGLDAAVGGAFLALLWPRLTSSANRWYAIVAAAIALVSLPFVPAGMPVLIAGASCLLIGLLVDTDEPSPAPATAEESS